MSRLFGAVEILAWIWCGDALAHQIDNIVAPLAIIALGLRYVSRNW